MELPPVDPHLFAGLAAKIRPIPKPHRKLLTEKEEQARELSFEGFGALGIAEQMGVSRARAYQLLGAIERKCCWPEVPDFETWSERYAALLSMR